ncbi:MAG: Arc family DNA-binding protein [Candidatus Competibacter denitrificans]
MATQDTFVRITLRMPLEMHDRLQQLRKKTKRSLNAEILTSLDALIKVEEDGITADNLTDFAEGARTHFAKLYQEIEEISKHRAEFNERLKRIEDAR